MKKHSTDAIYAFAPLAFLLLTRCSPEPRVVMRERVDAPTHSSNSTAPPAPQRELRFEDRLWQVTESSAVATGTTYLFRSDGSLVITSPGSTPLSGSWSRKGDGLEMVEDSIAYRVDILELSNDSFSIRSHNPGEPVDIRMAPVSSAQAPTPQGS